MTCLEGFVWVTRNAETNDPVSAIIYSKYEDEVKTFILNLIDISCLGDVEARKINWFDSIKAYGDSYSSAYKEIFRGLDVLSADILDFSQHLDEHLFKSNIGSDYNTRFGKIMRLEKVFATLSVDSHGEDMVSKLKADVDWVNV